MYDLSTEELSERLVDYPMATEFCLREPTGKLVRTITTHEVEVLAFDNLVDGTADKNNQIRWIRLKVSAEVALRRLNRSISRVARVTAEDNATVRRVRVPGRAGDRASGGIYFEPRHTFAWSHIGRVALCPVPGAVGLTP